MNFEQFVDNYLEQRCLGAKERAVILEAVKASPANESMAGRWNDDVEGYPLMIRNVLSLTINTEALKYIDEFQPEAFYRVMFTGEVLV